MRKNKFDHAEAQRLYADGKGMSKAGLARHFNVSRQAIHDALRPPPEQKDILKVITPERLDEIALTMYERAMKYPGLLEENNRLKNIIAAKDNQIKILEEKEKEIIAREQRFNLAKQQGEISGPVGLPGKASLVNDGIADITNTEPPLVSVGAFNINSPNPHESTFRLNINPTTISLN